MAGSFLKVVTAAANRGLYYAAPGNVRHGENAMMERNPEA
jgi:hypothetical protein